MDGCVVLNVRYSRDRGVIPTILKVPTDITWADLELLLKLNFDCGSISVKYLDEDNDFILMSSQAELEEAFKFAINCRGVLELNVTDCSPPKVQKILIADRDTEPTKEKTCDETLKEICEEMKDEHSLDIETDRPVAMETQDDALETGEHVHGQIFPSNLDRRGSESKRGARSKHRHLRRSESCYARCAREIGDMRRSQSQPEVPPRRPIRKGVKEEEDLNKPVSCKDMREFLNQLKEDLRSQIVRDVTRNTVNQVLKGLDGAVIQSVQGSKPLPTDKSPMEIGTDSPSQHPTYIHDGIMCDNCDQVLVGVRYKCGNCADYDLCETCEALDGIHNPEHVFVKLRRPFKGIGRLNRELVPLLRCLVYQSLDEQSVPALETDVEQPRWERFKEKMVRMQEKFKKKEEKMLEKHKKKEEKLKRRLDHQRSLPVKKERLDLPPRRRHGFGAEFLEDVTIPDGTRVQPGTKMAKTWLLRNSGSRQWEASTKFKMVWGSMEVTEREIPVPHLSPGDQGQLTVELIAPLTAGRYQSHWKMQDSRINFGDRVWCAIIVEPKLLLEPSAEDSLKVVTDERSEVIDHQDAQDQIKVTEEPMMDGSVPMIPLVSALPLKEVSEPQTEDDVITIEEPNKSVTSNDKITLADKVEENLTTAAAVVARLQQAQGEATQKLDMDGQPASDLLTFELVENQEVKHLLQAVTPNNTPAVLTPPKSPVGVKLEGATMSNSSSVEIVGEEENNAEMVEYVKEKMAALTFKSDMSYELESISSSTDDDDDDDSCSSSDGDFFIVPLPDCFHPDKPLTRSQLNLSPCDENFNVTNLGDLNSQKSLDDILSLSSSVPTPTLSPIWAQTPERDIVLDTADSAGCKPPSEQQQDDGRTTDFREPTVDGLTGSDKTSQDAQFLAELAPQDIPLPMDPTEEAPHTIPTVNEEASQDAPVVGDAQAPGGETEGVNEELHDNGNKATDQNVPPSEQDTQQARAGEFANQLMNTAVFAATRAASQAYSTAKEVFLTWQAKQNAWSPPPNTFTPPQSTWTPPENKWTPPESTWTPPENSWTPPENKPESNTDADPIKRLVEMGFFDMALNKELLEKFAGDLEKVIQELLQNCDNDWAAQRH